VLLAAVAIATSTRLREILAFSLALSSPGDALATNAAALPVSLTLWWRPWALSVEQPQVFTTADTIVGAILLLAMVLGAAAAWRARAPMVTLALLWPIVALLPTHSVFARLDPITEKALYPAWIGPSIALGAAFAYAPALWPRVRPVLATALLLLLGALCWWRASVWADPAALWREASVRTPDSARAWSNRALAELGRASGRWQRNRSPRPGTCPGRRTHTRRGAGNLAGIAGHAGDTSVKPLISVTCAAIACLVTTTPASAAVAGCDRCSDLPRLYRELLEQEFLRNRFDRWVKEAYYPVSVAAMQQSAADQLGAAMRGGLYGPLKTDSGGPAGNGAAAPSFGTDLNNKSCALVEYVKDAQGKQVQRPVTPEQVHKKLCAPMAKFVLTHEGHHQASCRAAYSTEEPHSSAQPNSWPRTTSRPTRQALRFCVTTLPCLRGNAAGAAAPMHGVPTARVRFQPRIRWWNSKTPPGRRLRC